MSDNLYKALRSLLFQRWGERLQGILAGGQQAKSSGMTVPDAYSEGYRVAYFDVVADLIAAGFIVPPTMILSGHVWPQASDQVH